MNLRANQCDSCGASIIWIKDQNGTRIPLNKGRVRVYTSDGPQPAERWLYAVGENDHPLDGKPRLFHISHFITCPNATHHSKKGGSDA